MKKLFLLFITVWALLYCSPSYRKIIPPDKINVKMQVAQQQAYWLYFGTTDRVAVRPQDAIGRMKRGDLVQVLPVSRQFIPTAKEQQAFAVIKVTGITKREIDKYTGSWNDTLMVSGKQQIKYKSYRKWKTNLSALKIKRGLDTTAINFGLVRAKMQKKTPATLLGYERKCLLERYVNNPIRNIFNWTIQKVYAAEQITTCNKVGETYNTIVAWEAAEDGAMTTGNPVVLELYDDDGILKNTTRVDINGWTGNDATTQIIVRTATGEQHTGKDSTGFQRENTGINTQSIIIREDYTIINGLEINHGGVSDQNCLWLLSGNNVIIRNNIIWNGAGQGIIPGSGISNFSVYNNIVYDFSFDAGVRLFSENGGDVFSNTVYGCQTGIRGSYATGTDSVTVSNNACFGNSSGDFFGEDRFKVGSTNNCTSDSRADNTPFLNGIINKIDTNNFTDPSARDFSVKNNLADIYNAGTDLSGTFTTDIISITRPQSTSFDIGAFEFIVGGGGTAVTRRRLVH